MSEENTEKLEGHTPFEIRVLRELSNLNRRFDGVESRLTSLGEKVDTRLQETRPIWEAVLLRLDKIETRLDSMDTRLERVEDKFDVVEGQWLDVRADIGRLKKRLPPPEVALTSDE